MKKLLTIFLATILTSALASPETTPDIEISTKGLVCEFCGVGIKKHFGKLDAVNKVTINGETQMTYLFLFKNKTLTDKVIYATMKKSGYEALKIKRK